MVLWYLSLHIISSALYKIGIEAIVVDEKRTLYSCKVNQMGTDIFANLVAAHFLYPNKNYFDFGTALFASCCGRSGEVLGVIIFRNYHFLEFFGKTNHLPEIGSLNQKSVLGHDTVSYVTSKGWFMDF